MKLVAIKNILESVIERANFEHIENNTSIFNKINIGDKDLDDYTLNIIKERFKIWADSWISDELKEIKDFLNN